MRLGARIVVLTIVLVGVANFLSLSVVALSLRAGLVADLRSDVVQAKRALEERLQTEAIDLQRNAIVLATVGDIYSPVGTANIDATWAALGLDLLVVRTPAGHVQMWGAEQLPMGELADREGAVIDVDGRAIYAVAIDTPNGGTITVGRVLDDEWVTEIASATSTELVIGLGGRVVAASTTSVSSAALLNAPVGTHTSTIESVPLVILALPLPGLEGRCVIAINEADAFARHHRTMTSLMFVGVVTILGAAGVAITLAGWLVAPIRQVTEEAERVALSASIDAEGSDVLLLDNSLIEAARIGDSLRTIINELRQSKALLEAKHEALQQARRAEAAKQRFLANMSHELRTPLSAIIGYTEMIREECARTELYPLMGDLERVLSASRYLLDLIDDILALTSIETGKMKVEPSAFQLGPIITGAKSGEQWSQVHDRWGGERARLSRGVRPGRSGDHCRHRHRHRDDARSGESGFQGIRPSG